jgi:hypothetical protein
VREFAKKHLPPPLFEGSRKIIEKIKIGSIKISIIPSTLENCTDGTKVEELVGSNVYITELLPNHYTKQVYILHGKQVSAKGLGSSPNVWYTLSPFISQKPP